MLVIPAIDLRGGRCVRLYQGRPELETVFSDDPAAMARTWAGQGARMLHVVDLDGAFTGSPQNTETIKAIVAAVKIPVQAGGGIRTLETIEAVLGLGVSRVVLGTSAATDPGLVAAAARRFGEQVLVGIDTKNGLVAVAGWASTVNRTAADLALELKDLGIRRVVYTDIRRDGTLTGPNLEAARDLARTTGLKVIASGGFSSLADIEAAKRYELDGVEGAILGQALYTGAISLPAALAAAEAERRDRDAE